MKTLWSNSTVFYDESEIVEREALVNQCISIVKTVWQNANSAIKFRRVETPILTPQERLSGHVAEGFPMLETERGLLRPETTAGSIAAFHSLFPMESHRKKMMPCCIYQLGKSFRDEVYSEAMRATKIRLNEFHQLEFELFAAANTANDYLTIGLEALKSRFGGEIVVPSELPHYSRKTVDWEFDGLEVAGCSERTDWPEGVIYEISIGIERLMSVVVPRSK